MPKFRDFPLFNGDLKAYLNEVELWHIESALDQASNNRTRAAAILGIQRTNLVEKMKRYGIFKDRPSGHYNA